MKSGRKSGEWNPCTETDSIHQVLLFSLPISVGTRIKNRLTVDPILLARQAEHSLDIAMAHETRKWAAVCAQIGKVDETQVSARCFDNIAEMQ